MEKFVHLHVHTEYSIEDGMVRIPRLMDRTIAQGMFAVAVTDQMNLFGMVKFYQAALSAGIKPLIGAEIRIESLSNAQRFHRLVLLCRNEIGYKNLIQLISRSFVENQKNAQPVVKREWLEQYREGLLVLSGALLGDVGHAILEGKAEKVDQLIHHYQKLFPDAFYLELQRIGHPQEEYYIQESLRLAERYQLPVVATNNVRFLDREDFEAHEARVCIHRGWVLSDPHRVREYTEQQYFRTAEEMVQLFADIPSAIQNSVEIAKRCNVILKFHDVFLPNFPIPSSALSRDDYFEKLSREGLEERLRVLYSQEDPAFQDLRKPYDERLSYELQIIKQMGFPGYFLIVADFIQWAKNNEIPVGPGRGSGAGSLVAYALKITDLDPLRFELLFERFLNPERVSMPDFDIDFCMDGRDCVIDYVAEKYGRQSVSQIITYGTMAARAVVRDVGRVLGYAYGYVDKIAKLIPFELGITLERALEQEPLLQERYQKEDDVRTLIDLAQKLEGIIRNAGKHAGGVVISPSRLTDFTPLYCEEGSSHIVTQFDKDDVEAIGLVKFDFLGLRTLTIIHWAVQAINRQRKKEGQEPIDISLIPLNDAKTFQLLKSCQTTAVFQLESRGMKDLINRLQPDNFEEIIALVALFRPGPLQSGMVDDFINRKHGRARVEYLQDQLKPILQSTYGVILYQEQVMQIARVLAGYTLGQADLLRKAMGKKQPEVMAEQRTIFIRGAQQRGLNEEKATNIFNLMEKFAGYGFNKSHSAAYALLAYQTAWLKARYPAEFMAAVLSSDMDNTDKIVNFLEECRFMNIKILPPNINASDFYFFVKEGQIIYGLGAIKGVGRAAVENILSVRENKPFQDLFDFCRRVDLRKANKRVIEALIKSGAMDSWGISRASLMATAADAIQTAEQYLCSQQQGQKDLFGGLVQATEYYTPHYAVCEEWNRKILLEAEQEALGLYLSGHPVEQYEKELQNIVTSPIGSLHLKNNQTVRLAGLITRLRVMVTKRGDKMAFITISDRTGSVEIAVFSDNYQKDREWIVENHLLVVEGEVTLDEFSGSFRLSAKSLYGIEKAREHYAKYLLIGIDQREAVKGFIEKLTCVIKPFGGGKCPLVLAYYRENAKALLPLGDEWKVSPTDELIDRLKEFFPSSVVEVVYH